MTGTGAADAPPVSARETPAAPTAGKEIFRRFRLELRFACDMVEPSCTSRLCSPPPSASKVLGASRKAGVSVKKFKLSNKQTSAEAINDRGKRFLLFRKSHGAGRELLI